MRERDLPEREAQRFDGGIVTRLEAVVPLRLEREEQRYQGVVLGWVGEYSLKWKMEKGALSS